MAKIIRSFFVTEINPINNKAKSIPYLNPIDKYGRTLWFSTFGFMIAFLSWYAFPPLLSVSIKKDLNLTPNEIANSNIIALVATLLVRLFVGPLCDRFGPRYVFVGTLIAGSIPTFLAGAVQNAEGPLAVRFFIGILGGAFVPCQVWSTGFYDKSVIGAANSITAGIGNAGGGITYFVMPAIYDSLVHHQGLSSHDAWRVSYVVPGIMICTVALIILAFGEDTPNGRWKYRGDIVNSDTTNADTTDTTTTTTTALEGEIANADEDMKSDNRSSSSIASSSEENGDGETQMSVPEENGDGETQISVPEENGDGKAVVKDTKVAAVEVASHEIIQKPTFKEALPVIFSPQTLTLCFGYFNTFGAELAVNSILGAYYLRNFSYLGQTGAANWAAMFGLLNVVTRPLGGFISDALYKRTKSLWAKSLLTTTFNVLAGIVAIIIGVLDPRHLPTMVGLIALMAIPLEAGNGSVFSLVPHVHPHANGILSGLVGAFGNFGGIVYAIIFRYNGTEYQRVFYIIGAMMIAMNLSVAWIKPIPKGQIGGR